MGVFGFTEIKLQKDYAFNVTNEHMVVIQRRGLLEIDRAQHTRIGDVMLLASSERVKVLSTRSFELNQKWTLGTFDGTVLVQGVLVSSMCDDSVSQLPTHLADATRKWRREHKPFFHALGHNASSITDGTMIENVSHM